jgi:hypothetical protein
LNSRRYCEFTLSKTSMKELIEEVTDAGDGRDRFLKL